MNSNKLLTQQLKTFINKMNCQELELLLDQFKQHLSGPVEIKTESKGYKCFETSMIYGSVSAKGYGRGQQEAQENAFKIFFDNVMEQKDKYVFAIKDCFRHVKLLHQINTSVGNTNNSINLNFSQESNCQQVEEENLKQKIGNISAINDIQNYFSQATNETQEVPQLLDQIFNNNNDPEPIIKSNIVISSSPGTNSNPRREIIRKKSNSRDFKNTSPNVVGREQMNSNSPNLQLRNYNKKIVRDNSPNILVKENYSKDFRDNSPNLQNKNSRKISYNSPNMQKSRNSNSKDNIESSSNQQRSLKYLQQLQKSKEKLQEVKKENTIQQKQKQLIQDRQKLRTLEVGENSKNNKENRNSQQVCNSHYCIHEEQYKAERKKVRHLEKRLKLIEEENIILRSLIEDKEQNYTRNLFRNKANTSMCEYEDQEIDLFPTNQSKDDFCENQNHSKDSYRSNNYQKYQNHRKNQSFDSMEEQKQDSPMQRRNIKIQSQNHQNTQQMNNLVNQIFTNKQKPNLQLNKRQNINFNQQNL